MTCFWMYQPKDTKQTITMGFLLRMHSPVLLYLSKALIQLPGNRRSRNSLFHSIFRVPFHCVIRVAQRESYQNWQILFHGNQDR